MGAGEGGSSRVINSTSPSTVQVWHESAGISEHVGSMCRSIKVQDVNTHELGEAGTTLWSCKWTNAGKRASAKARQPGNHDTAAADERPNKANLAPVTRQALTPKTHCTHLRRRKVGCPIHARPSTPRQRNPSSSQPASISPPVRPRCVRSLFLWWWVLLLLWLLLLGGVGHLSRCRSRRGRGRREC